MTAEKMISPVGANSERPRAKDLASRSSRTCARGVTLVELCIVAGLLCLAVIIAWPSFKGTFFETNVYSRARSLSDAIIASREMALVEGKRYRLSVNAANASWYVSVENDPALLPGTFVPVSAFSFHPRHANNMCFTRLSAPEIVFNPDGTAQDWFSTLTEKRGEGCSVHFSAARGACDIT